MKNPNIFFIGPMGSGKSDIGFQLAKKLNMDHFDSDHEIERRAGAKVSVIFELHGEYDFRRREEEVINELTQKQGIVLSTGGGAVKSSENRKNLSARGNVIYLETSVETQLLRLQQYTDRPLIQDISSRKHRLETLAKERNALYEEVADLIVCTDNKSIETIVNEVFNRLEQSYK